MQKTCVQCQASFEVTDDDLAFYNKVSPVYNGKKFLIPPPVKCPDCRYQQRLVWRNERNMHRRKCNATNEDIVSIFPQDSEWPPVYKQSYWWSDAWDAKKYARDIDFSRPFFEQWAELLRVVPQVALNNQRSENSEFTNQSERNKDCYMLTCSNKSQDCLHGAWMQGCKNCVDCLYVEKCELCTQVINAKQCYGCVCSENLENCTNVLFSRNCTGCTDCFGCTNLAHKQYCFFDEQLSKEAYEEKCRAMKIESCSGFQTAKQEAENHFYNIPRKFYEGFSVESGSGDYLQHVKNTHASFNCRHCEDTRHCTDAWEGRNCIDVTETLTTDFCYSIEGSADNVSMICCVKSSFTSDALYCSHCQSCNHIFGCVGLRHCEYCILNKQYTKEEYEELVLKIIKHMEETGEWGQHFPAEHSPFAYNETVAQEYFPLTKEEALSKGYKWREMDDDISNVEKTIPASRLPDSINDIPDDILNWAITCEETKRPFKIIKQELDFYRKMHLPVPHLHPDERHRRRMARRNPRKLWSRTCDQCGKEIQTTYASDRPEIVYCEECYQQAVY